MKSSIKILLFTIFAASLTFAETASKSWTGASGASWDEAANWSPAGVPTENDAVTIPASASVYIPEGASVYSLDIAAGATLNLGSTGSAKNGGKATQTSDTANNLTLAVAQNMTVAGDVSLGGINTTNKVVFSVGGNLSLSDGAAMAIYAGVVEELEDKTAYNGDGSTLTVGGDFTIAQNAWLYPWSQTTNAGTVRLTVNGDVTIDAGGGIDASARGYEYRHGPGKPSYDFTAIPAPWTEGPGGSYGGKGGGGSAPVYGFANAPFNSGSPGLTKGNPPAKGNPGGGSIRLHVAGNVNISGSLLAIGGGPETLGNNNNHSSGSGGSVWVTCARFIATETAEISAEGGHFNFAWSGGGGGGRISILEGSPTSEQLDNLYQTGECENFYIMNETVDEATGLLAANYEINVKGGVNENRTSENGKNGTAVLAAMLSETSVFVTIDSEPEGIVVSPHAQPTSGQTILMNDNEMTFSALTPSFAAGSNNESRYHCTGYIWSNSVERLDGEATTITCSVSDGASQFLTWKWGNLEHHLDVDIMGEGTVSGERWWAEGATATLTAVPAEGWKFAGWLGDLSNEERLKSELAVVMERPVAVRAVFIPADETDAPATVTAIADGEWFNASTWDGGRIPGPGSDVTISGKKVRTVIPLDIAVKSLTLDNKAKLFLWGNGESVAGQTALDSSDSWDIDLTLDVKEDIVVEKASELSMGGLNSAYRPILANGGDLTITNSSRFAVYGGNVATNDLVAYAKGGAKITVGGTLSVGANSWVYPFSHLITGASPVFKTGSCFIAENGGFDADGRGYGTALAPGSVYASSIGVDGVGASYGGIAGRWYENVLYKEPYGTAWAPFWAGSPGTFLYKGEEGDHLNNLCKGGGAIIIQARRTVIVNGTLTADGLTNVSGKIGRGSGGSVWVVCREFTVGETATITAEGGSMHTGSSTGPGGGGRICVMEGGTLTEEKMKNLVLTGKARGIKVICEDLTTEDSPYPDVFSVKGGENTSDYYGDTGQDYKKGKPGTAVLLRISNSGLFIILH